MIQNVIKVAAGVTLSFATLGVVSANSSIPTQDNTGIFSGQAYRSDIASENTSSTEVQTVLPAAPSTPLSPLLASKITVNIDGGTFSYGVTGLIKYAQFSNFVNNHQHWTRAMMNGKSKSSPVTKSGTWAKITTCS